MPFPLIEFKLTPEQLEQLAPLAAHIKARHGSLIVEAFVVEGDYRYGTAKARYMDSVGVKRVRDALGEAEKDFEVREARTARLTALRDSFNDSSVMTIDGDLLTIRRDGFEYQVREVVAQRER